MFLSKIVVFLKEVFTKGFEAMMINNILSLGKGVEILNY